MGVISNELALLLELKSLLNETIKSQRTSDNYKAKYVDKVNTQGFKMSRMLSFNDRSKINAKALESNMSELENKFKKILKLNSIKKQKQLVKLDAEI